MFDPIKDGVVFYYRILNYMRNANFKKYTNMKFINLNGEWQKPNLGPGGIPGNSWWGYAARFKS